MTTMKQRFEMALARYKDVSDQLHRWEAVQVTRGRLQAEVRAAVRERIAVFNLFPLHQAIFALESNRCSETSETFERELARFDTAVDELTRVLANDGVPVRADSDNAPIRQN